MPRHQPEEELELRLMSEEKLQEEVLRLRNGIRKHRDERGHNRCWLDDQELYNLLPEQTQADTKLPPKDEFLKNCEKYWQERQKPNDPNNPNQRCCS